MQFEWGLSKLLSDDIFELDKPFYKDSIDPREIIAEREDVSVDNVLITHGATQGINISLLTAIAKIRDSHVGKVTVAVESPTYAPIPQSALILADEIIRVNKSPPKTSLGHWAIDRNEWQKAIEQCQIMMITPISNPSGWPLTVEDREWIVKQVELNDVILIADEAYNDAYRQSDNYRSIHSYGENCISINSLTKYTQWVQFVLAGLFLIQTPYQLLGAFS